MSSEGLAVFSRLPYTRQEADAILALAPATGRKVALGFEANRAAAMSDDLIKYRVIHFATHSILNSMHPELSGIALSMLDRQGKSQNGFLRAHEIFNLRLGAELVVLSGCRTGLGKEVKGEGLYGMTRGFMYAGSKRVLVSLWDVQDQATARLMADFYRGLLGAKRSNPAAALREAQIATWREGRFQAPYYWAAFVLQGEPK
jgi:CHAT domain-containing protein